MPKVTQNYKLFTLLESGNAVTVDAIKDHLGVNYYSVPVYIHELKRLYKADIESVREGRKVLGYKLTNAGKLKNKVPMYRSNNAQYVKPEKKVEVKVNNVEDGSVSTIDPDNELTRVSETEMADIKDSLGLNDFGGGGFGGDGW